MSQVSPYQARKATAFISCSLRSEDKPFVDYVEAIVRQMGFVPFGTIGRHDVSPKPIWEQMKDNIKSADCIVLAATPRYLQQDINDKLRTGKAMSEQLHTEVGMAVAADRPVLAFVMEGTEVGNFLPQAVQYIVLKKDKSDFFDKWPLIQAYCHNARLMIEKRWAEDDRDGAIKWIVRGLAVFGGLALLGLAGSSSADEDDEGDEQAVDEDYDDEESEE
jgi:hypothetical protein